jgi:hypothetical protein
MSVVNAPVVLGAVLRIDLRGWSEPAPLLPAKPMRVEETEAGVVSFFYDMTPRRAFAALPETAERIGMALEALLPTWPFHDLPFPARCGLEIGVAIDDPAAPWSAAWPAALLGALADADIELRLSVYPARDEASS